MKIISWNVNGIRAWFKKDAELNTYSWFLKQSPDFFCVQETKSTPDQLPDELLEPEGYFAYFDSSRTRKGYSGVGIYTKHEPVKVKIGFGNKELDKEGRMISLYYDNFVLINCYFPNGGMGGDKFLFKLDFFKKFKSHIKKLSKDGYDVVVVGDVNIAHEAIDLERDQENEKKIGYLPEERQIVTDIIESGFIDTFRALHPKTVKYSWWDMKTRARDRNVGWRIDYAFVSEGLKESLKKSDMFADVYGSDHCPIVLELKS
jgi:exodeoxyribonuclease-3